MSTITSENMCILCSAKTLSHFAMHARHRNQDVLTINCNTVDIKTQSEQIYSKIEDEFQCTKIQEAGKPEKCNVSTTSIQNLNSNDNSSQ